jgi:hypothetical protein
MYECGVGCAQRKQRRGTLSLVRVLIHWEHTPLKGAIGHLFALPESISYPANPHVKVRARQALTMQTCPRTGLRGCCTMHIDHTAHTPTLSMPPLGPCEAQMVSRPVVEAFAVIQVCEQA